MQIIWLVAFSLALPFSHALDWGSDHRDLRKFRARCRQVREHAALDPEQLPSVGTLGFFPLGMFESAQGRFSYLRALDTAAEARKSMKRITERPRKKRKRVRYVPSYDDHRAAFGLDRPALGVVYRGKIYLNDGNHKVIASHLLGATTMPVEIIRVWDDRVDFETFRNQMEELDLGHWRDYHGKMMKFLDLCDLVNDPNLFLARLEIRRATVDFTEEPALREDAPTSGDLAADSLAAQAAAESVRLVPKILKTKGAKRASAIKINQQPMIEMHWADALHRADRHWDDRWGADDLSLSDQKRDLRIVREAALDANSPLGDILLLDKPKRHPDLRPLIAAHTARLGCEKFLRHGVSE